MTTTIASFGDWTENTLDDATLHKMLLRHDSGVLLLPAPTLIEEVELITNQTIDFVCTGVQSLTPYLIIDAGSHFTEPTLA